MKENHFLAFDIGASSGRAVLGTLTGAKFEMREISRFANPIVELHGRYYWDLLQLYTALVESLATCARQGIRPCSIGIDTWGVDFGFVAPDGSLLGQPRAYRDPYTDGAPEEFFGRMPREELYKRTGIQVLPFNSLFQLYRLGQESTIWRETGSKMLFVPDLLAYLLTGEMACEYTIASTSQLLDAERRSFDPSLLEAVGLSAEQIPSLVMPGTRVGYLTDLIARKTGIGKVPVIAVAGHDTASAVVAVPASSPRFAYLSSGTWSLMGIEVDHPIIHADSLRHNFTNEGGIEGTIRFLKNITGMWILERCLETWRAEGNAYTYDEVVRMAEQSRFASLIDPDDPRFAHPTDMPREIVAFCEETGQALPVETADFVRCIFYSLANRYKEVVKLLSSMSPFPIERLHVIGGGSRNDLLNRLTAEATGLPVVAGPSEATAIGNCLLQAKAAGLLSDRWEMRRIVAESFPLKVFEPGNTTPQGA